MDVPDEETSVGVVVANLRIGIRTIVDTPMLRSLFLLGAPVFFSFGLWNVLLLPMAITVLGGTEFQYGIQEGLTSIGFVIGSLFMARYAGRLETGLWVFVGSMGMGVAGILYGLSPNIWIAIVFVMISGFFNSPSAVARQTLLQRNTPRELRGRVFSALFVMRDVIFLAGMAGAGLADVVDVRLLIVLASLILVVVALAALVAPGVGRPAAEWRRALVAPAGTGPGRASARSGRRRWATSTAWSAGWPRSPACPTRSGPRSSGTRSCARCPRARGWSRTATRRSAAYFILEGEAAAGIPEPDGGYRGLSTMGAGDFFGEIAALTGSPRTADVVATRASTLLEVPAGRAARRDGGPGGQQAAALDAHRAPAAQQPAGPAAPRLVGPGRAARPADEGPGRRGRALDLRRRGGRRGGGRRISPSGRAASGRRPPRSGVTGSSDSS